VKRGLTLAVVMLGLLAGSAQAAPFTPELEADYASALAWWGVASPPLCSSMTEELLPTDPLQTATDKGGARATQPSQIQPCQIMVFEDSIQPGCWEEMEIRHEVGHLLGYSHNTDPLSIMNADWDYGYWCPGDIEAAETQAAAEAQAARRKDWATWRAMRRACRVARGPYRARCWTELRELRRFIRA